MTSSAKSNFRDTHDTRFKQCAQYNRSPARGVAMGSMGGPKRKRQSRVQSPESSRWKSEQKDQPQWSSGQQKQHVHIPGKADIELTQYKKIEDP